MHKPQNRFVPKTPARLERGWVSAAVQATAQELLQAPSHGTIPRSLGAREVVAGPDGLIHGEGVDRSKEVVYALSQCVC